jgi:hypothetical protein
MLVYATMTGQRLPSQIPYLMIIMYEVFANEKG